ncbi:hypothetical protein SERLA73DRAFT_80339 [Serpula lacrymans var. lacrymans S7.3]|uniref:Uncharacterized protein n=1 Tax=Serpula lacrymans var. lacrymans (strain S7.3) TaxID=936435 RepID=F8QJG9_SERL3|nr:hypothetical protein SERLA73DRAFT_80339 [Serpula lacrymans var. lacrymans S7.3]
MSWMWKAFENTTRKRRELEADNLGPEQVVFDEVNLDEYVYDQENYDSDGSEDIFLNSLQEPFNNFLNDPAMQGNTQDNLNPDPEMQAGSPNSLHLNPDDDDDDDDERVVEQNENAGKVIRVDLNAHNEWREIFHQFHQNDNEMDVDLSDNRWAPFSTKLDWKFLHYVDTICWFGATNNYNTEMFEHFHIDMAKNAWRASNHRNERAQMTT